MDKMKKFVDSLDLEELSSREELVEMVSAQEFDKNQDVTLRGCNLNCVKACS